MVKYNKIRNVPLEVCSVEQKIAYNLAFNAHINFDYDPTVHSKAMIDLLADNQMQNYVRVYGGKYNNDAICVALKAGLGAYLEKPFIAVDYESIGKAFPKAL